MANIPEECLLIESVEIFLQFSAEKVIVNHY